MCVLVLVVFLCFSRGRLWPGKAFDGSGLGVTVFSLNLSDSALLVSLSCSWSFSGSRWSSHGCLRYVCRCCSYGFFKLSVDLSVYLIIIWASPYLFLCWFAAALPISKDCGAHVRLFAVMVICFGCRACATVCVVAPARLLLSRLRDCLR